MMRIEELLLHEKPDGVLLYGVRIQPSRAFWRPSSGPWGVIWRPAGVAASQQ